MKSSFPEKCKYVQALVLVVLSIMMVWLPTVDSFAHLDKTSLANENRAMAKFPIFQSGIEGLHQYFSGLESFFNDHFGFRNRLIRWEARWKYKMFNKFSTDEVIFGKEGWLFFSGKDMIRIVQGVNRFTPEELLAWKNQLESRRDWCAQRGIKYIFVVPPDKHSVYPEYLPDWLLPVKKPTKLDQFMSYMKTNSTVPILDLRPELLAAKTNGILYLLTDSHWNRLGAFIGYQTLINKLSEQFSDLKPLPMSDFSSHIEAEGGQDLARMIGQESKFAEKANVVLTASPSLKPLSLGVYTNILIKKLDRINNPMISINEDGKRKVILFHDSYAFNWQQILGYNFNKVYFIWQYNWDKDFIEKQKPDLVIDEMLERFVLSKDPNNITENN